MADSQKIGADFVDAFNAHDEERIRQVNGENVVLEAPGDVKIEGREAATQYAMAWLRAFPDAQLVVNNELVAGDWIVQECTFAGTHGGTLSSPAGDIPATNRSVSGRCVQIFRVDGDTVADTRLYFDQVEVMTQLGLMPEPATA